MTVRDAVGALRPSRPDDSPVAAPAAPDPEPSPLPSGSAEATAPDVAQTISPDETRQAAAVTRMRETTSSPPLTASSSAPVTRFGNCRIHPDNCLLPDVMRIPVRAPPVVRAVGR
ncbi:hypothetical protein GCM10010409_54630 [Mycolicibacterium diernhoferi]